MGRPKPCETTREFVAALARTVTIQSSAPCSWVARTGQHSIFALLSRVAPKVSWKFQQTSERTQLTHYSVGVPSQQSQTE